MALYGARHLKNLFNLSLFISFSGHLTVKSASKLQQLKVKLPLSRPLLEGVNRPASSELDLVSGPHLGSLSQSLVKEPIGKLVEASAQELTNKAGPSSRTVDENRAGKVDSSLAAVPEVAQAIGQIANYFGCTHPSPEKSTPVREVIVLQPANTEDKEPASDTLLKQKCDSVARESPTSFSDGVHGEASTTIGLLSHETIGRLAGEIAEKIAVADQAQPKDDVNMPIYAPEKCSTHDAGYTEGVTDMQLIQEETLLTQQEKNTDSDSSIVGDIKKLTNVLVTEEDIYGCPLREGGEDITEPCDMEMENKDVDAGGSGADHLHAAGCDAKDGSGDILLHDKRDSLSKHVVMSDCFEARLGGSADWCDGGGCGFETASDEGVTKKLSADFGCGEGTNDGGCSGNGKFDKEIGYTLEDQRNMDEFQKLTAMEEAGTGKIHLLLVVYELLIT